jgi:GNAT superfamily N-acetyltransferase
VTGGRSGVKALLGNGRIAGYAVFGPAGSFQSIGTLPFETEDEALFIGALYVLPEAREQNFDVDLLIAVMEFARGQGFERVQAVCREEAENEPEARAEILRASGFEVTEPVEGLCLASIDLSTWDEQGEPSGTP